MSFPVAEVEEKLGYSFKDKELLITAFTHTTYAYYEGGEDNERLEFLGDSVLQLVVTERLFFEKVGKRPLNEGEMTARRQKLVSGAALKKVVLENDLYPYLRTKGKRANIGEKTISSVFEAVVAAIYLDGGYDAAARFILSRLPAESGRNYKGELQEYLQGMGEPLPVYSAAEKSGTDNEPLFKVKVTARGKSARGEGASKAAAQQQAARGLLKALRRK